MPQETGPTDEVALTINGQAFTAPHGLTVADLLERLALDARTVVVERNGTILRDRADAAGCRLRANDVLEIVHFVGGG
jgi:thiamine biosynthesis protein ThiS